MTINSSEIPLLALLAGGKGTRLKEIAPERPKALVEVAGKPFIEHQLGLLRREKIKKVVICVGYEGAQIKDFVGNGSRFGLTVTYSADGEIPLGTGGAIRRALPQLGDLFWVMYGDSYLDIPFEPVLNFFLSQKKNALMTVYRNENRWDKSNLVFENEAIRQYDKKNHTDRMKHIDFGLGLFRPEAFKLWQNKSAFDLAAVYQSLIQGNDLLGYEAENRFYEIGSPQGLRETSAYLAKHNHP